jgi:hypothetical protein
MISKDENFEVGLSNVDCTPSSPAFSFVFQLIPMILTSLS